jgi:hypothetical protein
MRIRDLLSHLKSWFLHKSQGLVDLSHKHLRGGETLTSMKENANGESEGDRAPSSYLTGLLQNHSFVSGYN